MTLFSLADPSFLRDQSLSSQVCSFSSILFVDNSQVSLSIIRCFFLPNLVFLFIILIIAGIFSQFSPIFPLFGVFVVFFLYSVFNLGYFQVIIFPRKILPASVKIQIFHAEIFDVLLITAWNTNVQPHPKLI